MYESGELATVLGIEQPTEAEVPEARPAQAPPLSIENRL